jgi:hypothetical protein
MRKSVALPFVGLALASVIAVGCSGSGITGTTASTAPTPFPSPTASCTPPPTTTSIQQVFPQNNASAQPNLQGIVIAVAPNPLPTGWFFYVIYNATTTFSGYSSYPGTIGQPFSTPMPVGTPNPSASATASPSPLPTPSDTPNFANPIYESASLGIFANSSPGPSTFTAYLANASCYPGIQLSTFTTATVDTPTATPSPTATPT